MKWKEYSSEQRSNFYNDVGRKDDYFRNSANEASNRKTKFLTATNGGGVITLLSFVAASAITLRGCILIALLLFLIGLILNGLVIFMSENRLNKIYEGYINCINDFTNSDSELSINDFNQKVRKVMNEKPTSVENNLEYLSGLSFILAIGTLFIYFY